MNNAEVLSHADLLSMNSLLKQHRLQCLGHVRLVDGSISKDIIYEKISIGQRIVALSEVQGRLRERYKGAINQYLRRGRNLKPAMPIVYKCVTKS